MSWQDPRLWATLLAIEGVGPRTVRKVVAIIRRAGISAEEYWRRPYQLTKCGLSASLEARILTASRQRSLANFEQYLQDHQIQVVTDISPDYPSLLKQIPDCPPVLFIKGKLGTWDNLPMAVVGTRHATPYGRLATEKITRELVELGSTIVSGFMYGVDVLAQQVAVTNQGQTIGVLGFGFDHLYPRSHQRLFEEWLAAGQTFITEYAPATKPTKGTFVQRNRIVAGLSRAVIVVEAAARSGSLITAQAALEYDREVIALPGPINSLYSEGTAWLINQGASLVTSGRQALAMVSDQVESNSEKVVVAPTDPFQRHIYDQLRQVPQTEDQLQLELHQPMNQILSTLSVMEVAGWLKRTGDVWAVNV